MTGFEPGGGGKAYRKIAKQNGKITEERLVLCDLPSQVGEYHPGNVWEAGPLMSAITMQESCK